MHRTDGDLHGPLEAAGRATRAKRVPQAATARATSTGHSAPLGSTICEGGVNFSVFSRKATSVELV